jgi:hypothetical protein
MACRALTPAIRRRIPIVQACVDVRSRSTGTLVAEQDRQRSAPSRPAPLPQRGHASTPPAPDVILSAGTNRGYARRRVSTSRMVQRSFGSYAAAPSISRCHQPDS